MNETISKSEAKQMIIKELDTYLMRQKYKKPYFLSQKTKYSTTWYSAYGAKLELVTHSFKLIVNVMSSGEVSLKLFGDTFGGPFHLVEESHSILTVDDYDSLTESRLSDVIHDTKKLIRYYVKRGQRF